jgi:hypothetical protein
MQSCWWQSEANHRTHRLLRKDSKTPRPIPIALKYVAAFSEVTKQGDKTVVIPYESSALLGSVKTLANIFEK